jgi:hypothetical protein
VPAERARPLRLALPKRGKQAEQGETSMSKSRFLSLLVVLGTVWLWLALATASGQRPDDQSQRAADIRWFLDRAKQATPGMRSAEQKANAYSRIASAQALIGDFGSARRTAAGIEEASFKASAYANIAVYQALIGDFPGAVATTADIMDPSEKPLAYASIAKAQARVGQVKE